MNLLFDRVYVINLKRRPDKLAHVMDQLAKHDILGSIPVEVIPGVDGQSEVNEEFLAANNYNIYNKWTDPWWGRTSLKGEIGCNITHHKIWEKISKLDENVLVLEDDIVLENDFFNTTLQIAPQVKNLEFEFLYIGRKAIFPEKEKRLTDLLLVPDYSYWTCAYVITPQGAKKLSEGGYEQNINVPTDEYLPYMYGAPHESALDIFSAPQNLKAYALIDDLGLPADYAFQDSETEKSEPYQISEREDVKVFAFATEANDGLKMLYESSLKYGVPLEYAGLNEEWTGGNESRLDYPGGGQKVNILKNTIKDMVDDMLVIFTDGYDVLYNEGLNKIIDKFKTFNTKVLFGAEIACWPDENLRDQYPESVLNMKSPCKFLNSGVIIGYVGELKRITNEDISDTDDDQLYYTKKYLSGEFDIKLDHNCEIIQNLAQFDQIKINKLNSKLENTFFKKTPCIIHGNGDIDVKMKLYKMSSFLTEFKNHYGYTPVNQIEVNELPNVAYSVDVTETPENLRESLESLLSLDYPKEKIYLHMNVSKNSELAVPHHILESFANYKKFFYTDNHDESNILKENAFKDFLNEDIEYLFTIDTDCRINHSEILQDLIKTNKTFVSPLLKSKVCRFSNYWIGDKRDFSEENQLINKITKKTQNFTFDEYDAIYDGEIRGCFNVLFVDKCFLIKKKILPKIKDFYRKNKAEYPDKINFCTNMINEGVHMHLDNQKDYGFIV